jgi:hypothetical protein
VPPADPAEGYRIESLIDEYPLFTTGIFVTLPCESTTAISSGKAPGATTGTYMIVKLDLTPSTFAICALPSGIQQAAAHPGGIATGIDPGAVHAAAADGISPGFSYGPFNSTKCAILASIHAHGRP